MKRKGLMVFFLAVLMLLPALSAGAELQLTYIAGTAGANDLESPVFLFDRNPETKWCAQFVSPAYVIFRTEQPVSINGYMLAAGNDDSEQPGRAPQSWTLYGSNASSDPSPNDNSWAIIDKRQNDTNMQNCGSWDEFAFVWDDSTPAYQYYMLVIEKNHGAVHFQLSEFRLYTGDQIEADFTIVQNNEKAVISLCRLNYDQSLLTLIPHQDAGSDYLYWDGGLKQIRTGDSKTVCFRLDDQYSGFGSTRITVAKEQACTIDGQDANVECSEFVCIKIKTVRQ